MSEKPFVFISYSKKDIEKVREIHRIFDRNGANYWYDKDLRSANWSEQLVQKIKDCSQMIVCITPNSAESPYVLKEVTKAVDFRKEIVVIYLEETTLPEKLDFFLADIHAIHKENYSDEEFETAVCRSLVDDVKCNEVKFESEVLQEFLKNYEFISTFQMIYDTTFEYMYGQATAKHKRTGRKVSAIVYANLNNFKIKALKEQMTIKCIQEHPSMQTVVDLYENDKSVIFVYNTLNCKSLQQLYNSYKKAVPEAIVIDIAIRILHVIESFNNNNSNYSEPC